MAGVKYDPTSGRFVNDTADIAEAKPAKKAPAKKAPAKKTADESADQDD